MHTCKICNFTFLEPLYIINEYIIEKCKKCKGLQVKNPPSFEAISKIYEDEYFQKGKYINDIAQNKEQHRRLQMIRKFVPENSKVLDFGCATGSFIKEARSAYEMWGTDISFDAISYLQEEYQAEKNHFFKVDPTSKNNFSFIEDEFFDAITLWDVIEHLEDPFSMLEQINKKLKKNGFLFISTPNAGSLISKLMGSRWAFMTPPEHLVFFNQYNLQLLAARLNLDCKKWITLGKWVNMSFLIYKFNRVFPGWLPPFLLSAAKKNFIGKICLYIPTKDVQYAIFQKVSYE
jgi:2-polyprenyl-3-methyl-5-hydroxy-6-metoxy-1,4-benzoquinol methylase